MNTEIATTGFIKPYPQAALDGWLGLTSRDIAAALQVEHKHVLEKFQRNRAFLTEHGFIFSEAAVDTAIGITRLISFDQTTAQYIVCTWKNNIGVGYFRYLKLCEKQVEKIPDLLAEMDRLRADVRALTTPKARRLPGQGIVEFIKKIVTEHDIFGTEERRVVTERKAYALLTDEERRRYKVEHRARTIRGMSARQDEDVNYADIPRLLN